MEERIEVVTLACHGAVVDWQAGVESVLYAVARRHGEAPIDRGRALRRRLEALGARFSFAAAYEALVAERGYRWADPGATALEQAAAACRPFADVAPALESAASAGLPVVAVSDADARLAEAALRPLDGGFASLLGGGPAGAVLALGIAPARVLHVATAGAELRAARAVGMRCAWLNRHAAAPPDAPHDAEWPTLAALAELAAQRTPVGARG
jgi:FMN phosphatase YigB (HAD superfamily)